MELSASEFFSFTFKFALDNQPRKIIFILYFIFFDLLSVCDVWLLLFTRIKVFTFFVSCYFNNIITFWMTVLNTLTVKQSLLYGMWMKRKQKWTENRKKMENSDRKKFQCRPQAICMLTSLRMYVWSVCIMKYIQLEV